MWDREGLKRNAKGILKGNYWEPFIVTLIFGLLSGGSAGNTGTTFNFNSGNNQDFFNYDMSAEMLVLILSLTVGAGIIAIIIQCFLIAPIQVGMQRYFMENREENTSFKPNISRMFCVFKSGHYLKVVKVMFLMNLKIFLWSLLFIIPGIVKSFEYSMIPYILAENPELDTDRIFKLSRQMTDNEKLNIFVLDLSFIGWYLLGFLACGLGVLFVNPYYYATHAELYGALREKAFMNNFSSQDELFGFNN